MHPVNNTYKTTCCYCGVGCGILVSQDKRGQIKVQGDPQHPVNRGMLCSKGLNLHYTVMDQSDRLLHPQLRWKKDQPLQQVDWDTALEKAATVFRSFIAEHGPNSVGFYVSGQCLTEEYYLVNKITKGFIGTNNIDTNSRLCMSSAVAGYKLSLGEDAVPICYDDIELADCFLIAGANPAWCHPILFRRIEAHKARNPGVRIIVVDPRKTQTAEMADLHLQINPGTDIVLYHAIARGLIENNFIDESFIAAHTEGYDALKKKVMKRSLQDAAAICGVKFTDIYRAVKYIGSSGGFLSLWAMGLNQSVIGVNKNLALINLSLLTGKIGKPGCGPFSLTGQPNAMGGREVGGLSNLLPAHRDLNNPQHRQEVADYWGVPSVPSRPGLTATEMFDALREGRMKAIWIICTNPLVSIPNSFLVEEALNNADFVVVQDVSSRSDTISYADLVLPAAAWMEKEGTMTNSERRITYLPKVIDPPGDALPDAEILCRFAAKMGWGESFRYNSIAAVYAEYCGLTKRTNIDISGVDHERLKKEGSLQWPVPAPDSSGTPRLFTDHLFYTPNQKAKLHAVPDENQSECTSKAFPLILTTGRIRDQWHTMTKTGKVNKLRQHIDKPFVEIHPFDAEKRGIADGDPVTVTNDRGTVTVTAILTENIKKGVVFLPMHWGKILNKSFARANNLTPTLVDPVSKEPDFKFSAVEVTRYIKPHQQILIVGGGIAVARFLSEYRQLNSSDELHVFSAEEEIFYDRNLLPAYISDTIPWENLVKLKPEYAEQQLNVKLHTGLAITAIDPESKCITDAKGTTHSYDVLILATGSRALYPPRLASPLAGIFTLRTKADADACKKAIRPGEAVVILGGDLQGLRLANALCEQRVSVHVIQSSARLMEEQLDETGSELLQEVIEDRGIRVWNNTQIINWLGNERIDAVELSDGTNIPCSAVIVTMGTVPHTKLAKEAGLCVQQGIKVNAYLQTSDPNIYAIGEVAEFNHTVWQASMIIEEQATILARHLYGDPLSYYQGSIPVNILELNGWELATLGITCIPPKEEGYEEIVFLDKYQRYYKKCIIHRDKLVGALLLGDQGEFKDFKDLIVQRTELAERRAYLLRSGGSSGRMVKGKIVCACNNVGEGNLTDAIKEGCSSMTELCTLTTAGTKCGSCKPEIKAIWNKALQAV